MRRLPLASLAVVVALLGPAHAEDGRTGQRGRLRVGSVEVAHDGGELTAFLAASKDDGAPAKLTEVHLLLDGKDTGAATAQAHLTDVVSEQAKWTPPVAVGLVYLWSKDAPKGMIDGIEALAKHLPGRTTVYPTPYGQGYRPVVTRVLAARAAGGDLADYAPIEGDRHKVVDAVRFNARKLAEDTAGLKYLVVVTDGRGFESAREKGPFSSLGEELAKMDLTVLIASFAAPVDGAESAANVRELAQAAGARHVVADRGSDLPALVESLAETINGLDRVKFKLPWSAFADSRKVSFSASIEGATVTASGGEVTIPGRGGWLIAAILVVAAAGLGVVAFLLLRKGGAGSSAGHATAVAPPGILRDADDLVRIGLSPERAVIELSRSRPDSLDELRAVDPAKLPKRFYVYLRSRAGQARLKEIQKLLARAESHQVVDEQEAQIVASALKEGAAAAEAARRIRARIPGERWSVLARASEEDLTDAARAAARKLPDLGTPRGLEFVEGVQQALRSGDAKPVMVGWLVRAAGPGERGEMLPIKGRTCTIGKRGDILLADASEEHAEIRQIGAGFVIAPADGEVEVEGEAIEQPHPLVDGETVRIGRSAFVFRSVRWGISVEDVAPEAASPRPRTAARRAERPAARRRPA